MALTKVTGHVVKPDTNIQFHNTKSTGIVTFAHTSNATSSTTGALQITGGVGIVKDLHVGGNVTVGGTLTYEDVTNIDSVGLITAREGIFLPDNKQVKLGNTAASPDFKIYHNTVANTTSPPNYLYANSNYIDSVASQNLFIRTSTAGIYLGRTDGAHAASFHTNGSVVLYHNASGGGGEKFRTAAGGISVTGTTTSSGSLTVTSGNITASDGGVLINGAGGAVLYLNDSNDNPDYQVQNIGGAFAIKDGTNNAERLSITSDGKIGINETSPDAMLEVRASNTLEGLKVIASNTKHGITLIDGSTSGGSPSFEIISKRSDSQVNTAFSSNIFLGKNRTDQKVTSGIRLGTINFGGNHTDGTEANISYSSSIQGIASGDFNSKSDMPTDLVFTTGIAGKDKTGEGAGQSNVGTERLRITSAGVVQVGKDDQSSTTFTQELSIRGRYVNAVGDFSRLMFRNSTNSGNSSASIRAQRTGDNYGTQLSFFTQVSGTGSGGDGLERLRITSDGKVGVGDFTSGTAVSQALHVKGSQPEIYLEHTGGYDMTLTTNDGAGQNGITVNGGYLSLAYNNKNIVMCRTGGNVGIGSQNPSSKLDIAGNFVIKDSTAAHKFELSTSTNGSEIKNRHSSGAYKDITILTKDFIVKNTATNSPVEKLRITSGGSVGIGTLSPREGNILDIFSPSSLPTDDNASVGIANTNNKTYPTSSSFSVTVGLKQKIEIGGTQTIDPTTPGGYNYISGITNELIKNRGNTQDIERSYYYGINQRLTWSDSNTLKQYVSINDSLSYFGKDANGRTSSSIRVRSLSLDPGDGNTQTHSNIESANPLFFFSSAGTRTINITNMRGYVPTGFRTVATAGTLNGTATNVAFYDTSAYWGTTVAGSGSVNYTITNLYGLILRQPAGTTGLTITNKYGIYQEWSSANNYFAGKVGINTTSPGRQFVVVDSIGSGIGVVGGNAGIYMGEHHTGGFINNCAIARAAANNYHITGSAVGDLCIAGEESQNIIFGTSAHAGAMAERLRIKSDGNIVHTSTNAFQIAKGTTAQRPSSPVVGMLRFNTTTDTLENYNSSGWQAVNVKIPAITSISGEIYAGLPSNLTINGNDFDGSVTVIFKEGSTTRGTLTGQSVSAGSLTVTVPSGVYGQSVGDTITITITNADGVVSAGSNKTIQSTPTGGSVSTSGNYRVHTFTSSGTLTAPSGWSTSYDYLVVAGGGSGGNNKIGSFENGGGGGAGGMLTGSSTLSAGSYSISIGGGAAIPGGDGQTKGGNTTAFGLTAIGGGGGRTRDTSLTNCNGGSGGGTTNWDDTGSPGSGTSGQGNNGGTAGSQASGDGGSGGGGGKGATGGTGSGSTGGNGGSGGSSSISGSSVVYAGGGGGGGGTGGSGGSGGGGNAGNSSSNNGSNGTTNRGGGGGGNHAPSGNAGNGGSGIVILRYKKI